MNCWEYMRCPPQTHRNCPAWPKRGQECWKLDNTICDGGRKLLETLEQKVAFCRRCDFYVNYAVKHLIRYQEPGPGRVRPEG